MMFACYLYRITRKTKMTYSECFVIDIKRKTPRYFKKHVQAKYNPHSDDLLVPAYVPALFSAATSNCRGAIARTEYAQHVS